MLIRILFFHLGMTRHSFSFAQTLSTGGLLSILACHEGLPRQSLPIVTG